MTTTKMTLVDWLDDLCVRFIVNLPNEELQSVERICFQIEEAQWFYEDFIRPLDPHRLPSMHLRRFSQLMFQHCPLFSAYSEELHQQAYEQFLAYKTRVPVRGVIMLNQEMSHAVLVKGWKKGAKWSFPRGKINNQESDLDCAVREAYEETGYDLREADLVLPDEQMKKITVTMREQSMMLYVFRGVPMDTYFEPRTRKEISKIDWYKLTDLPTLRRKNQLQQQVPGQDLIKESSFYMVAPFLGPLRSWIKQQQKTDRQRPPAGAPLPPAAYDVLSDPEDPQAELYETPADEVAYRQEAPQVDNLAGLIAQLGHRSSDTLPEVSTPSQVDPAEALKRLLSVGSPTQQAPQVNPLLAILQGKQQHGGPQMAMGPRTPFEQIMSPPTQPQSPHGQHQPRQPQFANMPPPPPFSFSPNQGPSFHGPPPQQPYNGMPEHMARQFMPPPQPPHQQHHPAFTNHPPTMQQAFNHQHPRSFQPNGDADSHFAAGHGRPSIPPASGLPTPKLNSHALSLLNSFRPNDDQPAVPLIQQVPQTTPRMQQPLPQYPPHNLVSPPYAASPPQYQSPALSTSVPPAQPRARTTHQNSLLTLFQDASPMVSPEPAELSAYPRTPGYVSAKPVPQAPTAHQANLLGAFGVQPKARSPSITSATVSGPVNAPDFKTIKRNVHPHNSSSGPSPVAQVAQKPFVPQQILKREATGPGSRRPSGPTVTSRNGTPQGSLKAPTPTVTAFKPQILKRPQQQTAHAQGLLDMFKAPSPQPQSLPQPPPTHSPAPPPSSNTPVDQKSTLLALFGKPSPSPVPSIPTARTPAPTSNPTLPGIVSPVSPLPEKESQAASPGDFASRSRISSIGESVSMPSIVIPPVAEGANLGMGGLSAQAKQSVDGRSPVDKSFLLGFLEDVARKAR
ncbi:hypothetical protein P153DRAFT_297490 [Dothidotthia symphoricarpi CBS 119687]|uniref:Nudix hydrolase domain-containing protein n=1 Tax=Dothidotthia symphoricarpi CBS 119687 TaxID=1392245 RepID=A0A6A6A414_9PLEO|nr:uncharacterized protein P153DRAFT_297490 [Dothidotthia symphoricarpi CBS 119687]KAF2126629.1 hypothetical protein P153DRAFT_297490 [Dothidotthia symphoricarpi CBS 119687]